MTERKASEVLLDLEQRINNIETLLKLQEFQLRLVIDNFNKFFRQIEESKKPKEQPTILGSQKTSEIVKTELADPIEQESIIDKKNRLMKIEHVKVEPNQKQDIAFKSKKPERLGDIDSNNTAFDNERKVPVHQKLILYDGTPMSGAKVLVKNENGDVIKTAETNQTGRWQAALSPGKYSINVSGKHNGQSLECNQTFEVPAMSSPLELPSPQAYKRKK